jgi:AraC-like DNA-binding protein
MDFPAIGQLDLALRGGLIAVLMLLAALLWRDHARSVAARLGAAFAVGTAAHVLHTVPGFGLPPPAWWQAPIIALAAANSLLFWLFARALFDDEFELRWPHGALWTALAAAGLVNCYVLAPSPAAAMLGAGLDLAALAFALLAIGQSLATWRADLVEGRRRLRGVVVGASGAYSVVVAVARLATAGEPGSAVMSLADALGMSAVVLLIAWPLLRVSGDSIFGEPLAQRVMPAAATVPDAAAAVGRVEIEADTQLIAALNHLMTVELVYREEKLTIGALADRLGVPEYKLRRVINQQLGHRNFNAFLNRHRIEDARRALADPAMAQVAVLDIAMDAGFQSLGPFNRAFKADTGMTPTEFRRQHVRTKAPNPVLSLADSDAA